MGKDKDKKAKDKKAKDKAKDKARKKDKKSKDKKAKDKARKKDKKDKDKKAKDKKSKDKKADLSGVLPKVVALLESYKVSGRPSRAQERILDWAAKVNGVIVDDLREGARASDLLEDMVAEDHRLQLFYLEGILKLYRKQHPELEVNYRAVKALEDKLGQQSAAHGFAKMAKEHNAPEPALSWLDSEDQRHTNELLDLLRLHWLPVKGEQRVPAIGALVEQVMSLKFNKPRKDLEFLQEEVADELVELEELELDMNELQGDFGVHELRRKLRWFPIYAVSTGGLFQLVDGINPIERYIPLLDTELANSKYSQLPPGDRDEAHVEISRSLFVANNGFISKLGAIKDRGEQVEAIELALVGAGLHTDLHHARPEALQILGKTEAEFNLIYNDAQAVLDELDETGFVTAVRADVEDG